MPLSFLVAPPGLLPRTRALSAFLQCWAVVPIMYPRFNPAVVRLLVLMVSGPVIVSMLSVAPRHLAPMLYAAVQALLVVKSSV